MPLTHGLMATASLGSATDGRSVLLSGSDSTFTNELQDDLSGDLIAYCLASATTASPIVGTVSEITMGRVAFPIESFFALENAGPEGGRRILVSAGVSREQVPWIRQLGDSRVLFADLESVPQSGHVGTFDSWGSLSLLVGATNCPGLSWLGSWQHARPMCWPHPWDTIRST